MRTPEAYHHTLIDYLTRIYGEDNLLVREEITYPVYVYPAAGEVDSLLVENYPMDYIGGFAAYDDAHLRQLRESRPHLTNGLSYVLDEFSVDTMLVSAKLGYYFDMLATCDALDQELRRYARGEQDTLPNREKFHQTVAPAEVFFTGRGRAAIFGICTLTVFNNQGTYELVIGQRPASMGVGAGLYHVYPAFVFQPSGPPSFYEAEWSIQHQLYREFGEELFAVAEFPEWDNPTSPDYFFENAAVADLREMVNAGRAEMHITGVALNPLSLRPEVCTLLMIHDETWFSRWQAQLQSASMTERQKTVYMPLAALSGRPQDMHITMTPHGAAAFWLGVERAREVLADKYSSL